MNRIPINQATLYALGMFELDTLLTPSDEASDFATHTPSHISTVAFFAVQYVS